MMFALPVWTHGLVAIGVSLVLAEVLLCVIRRPARRVIRLLTAWLVIPLRRLARRLTSARERLASWNQAVLMAHMREDAGDYLEREFWSVEQRLQGDMAPVLVLADDVRRQMETLATDHAQASEKPEAFDWPIVPKGALSVLERRLLGQARKQVLQDYQRSFVAREVIWRETAPALDRLAARLKEVDQALEGMLAWAASVDESMRRYCLVMETRASTDRRLRRSSVVQAVVASALLALGGVGVRLESGLVAHAMTPVLGELAPRASEGLVLVLVVAGFSLTESLGWTRLLPRLSHRGRRWIAVLAAGIALAAAVVAVAPLVGVSWAPWQVAPGLDLSQGLQATLIWLLVPVVFFLPLALDMLWRPVRMLSGVIAGGALGALAMALSLTAGLVRRIGLFVTIVYEGLIVPGRGVRLLWRQVGRHRPSAMH